MIAGIYVRTSTLRQAEEGTSLETQEEQARLKAVSMGYKVGCAYIWRETESGAYMDRPVLELMLQAVRNRKVDIVVVYDHDRLARDPLDLLNIQRVFIHADVRLEFVRGPSDTSPEGQLMTYFLGYAAQRERLQFMERSMRGKERVARDGRMPITGGVGLYGYDYDRTEKKRVVNEEEASVVRMMFQWALEGTNMYRIACMLNEKRIPSKTRKMWNPGQVTKTLRNQAYTGIQYYGIFRVRKAGGGKREVTKRPDSEAILVKGFTPQLITPGIFEAVQQRLNARSARSRGKGPRYMMTGFTRCGKCGGPVVGGMRARGHWYYRCIRARKRASTPATCDAPNIRGDRLEAAVWTMVSDAIRHPEVLSREIQRHVRTGDGELGERMTKLQRVIADLKNQQRRLMEQRQKDIIDQDILESQIAPVKLLCDEKERELGVLEDQQNRKDAALDARERIAEYCKRFELSLDNLDEAGKRATFATFEVRVEVTRDDLLVTLEIDPSVTTIQPSSRTPATPTGYGYTRCTPTRPPSRPTPRPLTSSGGGTPSRTGGKRGYRERPGAATTYGRRTPSGSRALHAAQHAIQQAPPQALSPRKQPRHEHSCGPASSSWPRMQPRPSRSSHGRSNMAVTASSHHQPNAALATSPISRVAERHMQARVSFASVARDWRPALAATRSFQTASPGMSTTEATAIPMPTRDSSAPLLCARPHADWKTMTPDSARKVTPMNRTVRRSTTSPRSGSAIPSLHSTTEAAAVSM